VQLCERLQLVDVDEAALLALVEQCLNLRGMQGRTDSVLLSCFS
jgi:hypothetical protein